jgi:hypothetical protein
MIISSNFAQFCNFMLPFSRYSKFFASFSDFLIFLEFRTHNGNTMAKHKKVSYLLAGIRPGANVIKLFTAVIYGFCTKLVCF